MCRACTHSARLLPAALSECRYTVFFALSCAVSLGSLAVKIRLLIEKMQSRRKEMRQQSGGNARRITVAGVPMKVPRTLSERDAAKADRLRAKLEANQHEKRRYYCTHVPAALVTRGLCVASCDFDDHLGAAGAASRLAWAGYVLQAAFEDL